MPTRIKFYKGMTDSQAAAGLDSNSNIVDEGSILFSDGKRIYTKESNSVIEYYKDDLTFGNNVTANKGVLKGETLSNKTLKQIFEMMFLTTYAPRYTDAKAEGTVTFTNNSTYKPSKSYVLPGTNVNWEAVLSMSYTKAKTQASTDGTDDSDSLTSNLRAWGGEVYSFTYDGSTKTEGITSAIKKTGTVNHGNKLAGKSNTVTPFTIGNVVFSAGTDDVKDSSGSTTDKYTINDTDTDAYAKELGDATTGDYVNNHKIVERTVEPSVTGNSFTVYYYLPIYYSKEIKGFNITTITSDSSAKGYNIPATANQTTAALSGNISYNVDTYEEDSDTTTKLGNSDSYSIESETKYITFSCPLNAGGKRVLILLPKNKQIEKYWIPGVSGTTFDTTTPIIDESEYNTYYNKWELRENGDAAKALLIKISTKPNT